MHSVERRIVEIESDLANLSTSDDVIALTKEHQAKQEELEVTMAVWEKTATDLEELRSMQGS